MKLLSIHGLYEETKDDNDDGRDNDDDNRYWDDMEEKEGEEDDDDEDSVVDINTVKLFGMPDETFLGKETENKNKKEENEEKKKGDKNNNSKNSGGSVKRGKKMRGGIDMSASKGDNKDDTDLWDDHDFNVEGKEGSEWETTKGTGTTTDRTGRSRRKKRGGGEAAADDNEK